MPGDPDGGLTTQLGCLLGGIARADLSAAALEAARSRLFHAFGVSLASSGLPPAGVAWGALGTVGGDSLVFGRATGALPDDAAFVNGVIGHSSLQEDCGPGGLREGSHPGTYIIPAALAAAESVGASGLAFLRSVVVGYEAVGRIGEIAPAEIVRRGFRPVGIMGPFGAAAAAAAVYGCTDAEMAAALDIAANMAGGSTQGIFEGTMEPYLHAGVAARNGMLAARLARAGATTSRLSLEGEFGFFRTYGGSPVNGQSVAARDGFAIERLGTKRFAACLQNQRTMALIVDGIPGGLAAERVERVIIHRPELGTNGLNSPGVSRLPPFDNMLAAQMSARFTAAAALLGQPVDDPAYFQSAYADQQVTAVAQLVELDAVQDESVAVEVYVAGAAPVVLDGGSGDVLFPSRAEIRAGFMRRALPLLGSMAQDAAEIVDRLEDVADVRELTAVLRP